MNPPPTASLIVTPGQVIDSAATGSTAQPTRTLAISSTGQGAVIWAAQRAHGAAWLSFDITSGTTPTALSLSFNPASLSPGVYRDTVVLAPTVVPGEATRVPVEFRIQPCTVTPISLDVLVNDSLRTTDCAAPHGTGQFARLYSFHASAGDSVSVYTSASAFGVVLALDSSPSSAAPVLARSADCPLARQSACMVYRLLPQTGTYVVELASAATGQTGKFAVSVVPPHPPLVPDSLGQFQMDSVTPIHVGAAITQATLVFRGVVRDFDLSDSLSLQVEGRPLGSAFTGAPTASGSVVANGARASVAAGGLADNVAYHWQARVLDPTGRASAWVAFGNNPESAADFLVAVPQTPSGPTGASQLQADGTTPIALGGTDDGQSVVLMAMVADPDPNDQLRLEAEAQPVGTPFSNAPTASSTPVANGGTAVVTISGLTDNTAYHWQVRTVDQTALASPWSSFGANPEPDADFRVALAPTRLVVIAQPTNSPAGAAISPAVRVAAQDALGNTLASFTGDVTVTIGTNLMGGALSGTTTVTAAAGVATFPRLSINRAGTGYTLQFNTSALATISAAFNVTPAAIAQLVFTQQPTTTIAGNVIAPVIQIAARDSSGNTVTNFTGAVTIGVAANPGGGTLSGTATVAAIGGVATFANLSIDKVAAGYILQASSGAFTASSGAFDIAAAAGAQLRFAVQPTDATAGAAIAPAVTVTAVDPFGNIATSYTGSVTVGLGTNPGGGALAGSSSVAAVAGVARFTGLSVNKTGTGYTISAAAAGLAGATSSAFTITPAGTTRVAFTLQPSSSTIAGAAVTPAVQVSAQDAFGNTVPSFTGTISLALGSNPTGGVLAGGTTVAAVNGVASFADLSIATAGTGYTLTATAAAPGVAASTSSAFTITAATANHVAAITSDHQSATVGTAVAVAPAVIVKDQFGNPVAGVSLMFAVATGGGSLTGTNPVTTNGSGIAAIASWTLGSLTGTNTVTATASGLTGSPVSFTATGTVGTVSAAQSTVAVAPPAIPASTGMSASTITVTARDASGNPISGANVVLAATGTGNALTQPAGPTNASGVVTGTLSSSAAGPKTISATISGTALTQTATVIVSPDEPSGTQSTMSVTPATIIASSGASASTITVTVLDALGNAVSGATVTLAATGSGNTLIQPGAVTNASGQTTGTLSSTTAGTKTVSATVNNTVSVTHTATLSVTSAVASQMVVGGGDGQGATVGTVVAVAPAVLVKDAFGNPVAGVSVVFAVATGGGSLTGPTTVTTSGNGLAAVGSWMLGTLTGPNTLTATAPGLAGSPVTFTATAAPGSATQLGFTGQPSTATAGTVVTPAVQVTARDQFGNIATGYGGNVIVSLGTNPGGGSLGGTTTVAAVAGVASFTTLSVNKTGTGYTLGAAAAGLPGATSTAFTISPADAIQLAFTGQPGTTAAGVAVSPAVQVSAQDAFGNPVPSFSGTITVALGANPTGGGLAGTTTVTAVTGVASFTDLSINMAGTGYTLTATASVPGLAAATSVGFTITAATAHRLAFTGQPSNAVAGTALTPAVQVVVRDELGNTVTSFTGPVTVALGTNPTGGVLAGTTTVVAVNGVASFVTLSVNRAGTGYTLTAAAPDLTGATSTIFNIAAGPATRLAFSGQPSVTTAGSPVTPVVQVSAQDNFGNTDPTFAGNVTVALATNPAGGVLAGTTTVSATAGVARFTDLSITKAGTGYALVAAAPGLISGNSVTFGITAATASQLVFSVQPTNATAGLTINPAVQVTAFDQFGNAATSFTGSVIVALSTNPTGAVLAGTTTVAALNGVARFTDLNVNKSGPPYRLTATSGGLTAATSTDFDVSPAVASQMVVGGGDGQGATVGTVVAVAPAVLVKDAFGNPVAGVSVVFAVATGGGSLTGPTAVTTSGNGLAAVGGWMLGTLTGPNTLTATAPGLAGSPVTFTATAAPGSATQLGFTGQPSTATAGTVVTPAVQVTARDQFGNIATGYTGNVIVSLGTNPGGGSLGGTTTVAAVAGVASFTTLSVNKTGTGYTLSATAAGLPGATSAAFSITPAGATRLAFTVQPSTTAAGVAISPAVQVSAQDAFGNTVPSFTGTISVALGSNPTGGVLAGGTTVTAVNGVASFADLSLSTAGTSFTLTALASDLGGTTSAAFDITPATAHRLAFTVQPSNAVAGMVLTPAVQLVVRDELGNTVTSFAGTVTVALASNPAGGVLAGTTSVAAVNGVASFTTLSVNRAGAGYTLTAAALGLTGATSVTFSIAAGTATRLTFTGQPSATTAGNPVTPAVQVSAQDNFGNTDPTFAGNVTVAIGSNPSGGVLFGTTTVPAVNGVAPFGDLSITKTGTGYALVAATPGLISGGSAIFPITAATATQLAVAAGDGQGATVGTAVAVPPAVIARDRFGNPVPGVGVVFAVASGDGSLTGTNPVTTNGDGIAAIGGWTLGALTGANSFTATSTGLAGSPVTFTATGTPWNLQWPNVPASFTALTDQAWSTLDGWVPDPQDGYMSLVADQLDGPLSPPSAIQWRYPPGLSGGGDSPWGVGSVRFDVPIAHRGRELYLGLWARVNAGFQGHSSGVQKLAFLSAHETTARADLWLEISGAGSDPLGIQVIAGFQNLDTAAKYVPDPIGHPTETPVPVARGVWHRCEIYVRLPATNPGNGMMRVWVDGVLALDRTDVPMTFESLGWVQARLEPIWGGVDDMKTQEDFIWYDHTYVSAP